MIHASDEYLEENETINSFIENVQCDTTLWTPRFKCAVASCKNLFTKYNAQSIIKYHNFPINLELQQLWLERCCLPADFNISTTKVCTVHFLANDYKIASNGNRKVLKPDAVPTQFLNKPCTDNDLTAVDVQSLIDETILFKETHTKMIKEQEMLANKFNNLKKQRLLKKRKLKLLKKEYEQLKECDSSNKEKNVLCQVFSLSQINILLNKERVVWSNDDMAMAFTLRQMGNRDSYLYLKKTLNFPLPSLSSVQKWAASK